MRMTMSVALPGPNGTTTLTGLLGYLSWACAPNAVTTRQSTSTDPNRRKEILPVSRRRWFVRSRLFRGFDLHLGGNVLPGLDLVGEPRLGVVERLVRHDIEILLLEGVDHRRRVQRLDRGLEDRLQDLFRRAGRREQSLPSDRADAGIADLLHRRHVGKFGQALMVDQRERSQLAGFDLGRGRSDIEE